MYQRFKMVIIMTEFEITCESFAIDWFYETKVKIDFDRVDGIYINMRVHNSWHIVGVKNGNVVELTKGSITYKSLVDLLVFMHKNGLSNKLISFGNSLRVNTFVNELSKLLSDVQTILNKK